MDVYPARIAVVSANFGGFDKTPDHVKQSVDCDFYHITEKQFPLRKNSMTPRLQARIVKTHMWDWAKGYKYRLWVDSSCRLSHPDSVKWFLEQLGDADIAVFKHPHRKTVQDEADYLKKRLAIDCPYITPRYESELIDEQLEQVNPGAELYASTAFIYRTRSAQTTIAMKNWWYQISRYHSIDQLSLPWVIKSLNYKVIDKNYLKIPYLEYVRNK